MIKMKAWRFMAVVALTATALQSNAQADGNSMVMNLDQCLDYAKENSITLKQAQISVDNAEVGESNAKSAFLPSLSATVSQGFSNSPFISGDNPSSYQGSVNKSSYNGSYGVDMNMTLYNGGENALNLKQSRVSTEIAKLGVAQQEDILEINIAQLYVETLYSIEQIKVVESSIELSKKSLERGAAMKEVGSINEADYALLQSAVASDEYNLVVAQTSLSNRYVQLKQLLEISNDSTLEVSATEILQSSLDSAIPSINEVYVAAMDIRPEITSSTLSIESALLDEKIAKTGYLPTVNLSAGIGVNHLTGSNYTFNYQLKNNYSNSIGLNIQIPIFNKFATRNSVLMAKNATEWANLNYTDQTKELYQTIETLHTNAINAQSMYLVSNSKLQALERSLELVTEQYNVGAKNIIELLTEQDDHRVASQEFLQSKYTLMLNKALLEYYQTGIIKL
ncbi:MAG: TolC family protein [Rikenellaceae bacterium]